MSWRRPPVDAAVHASVEVDLQAHPEYWRRLPARIVWADADWIARAERRVTSSPSALDSLPLAELSTSAS